MHRSTPSVEAHAPAGLLQICTTLSAEYQLPLDFEITLQLQLLISVTGGEVPEKGKRNKKNQIPLVLSQSSSSVSSEIYAHNWPKFFTFSVECAHTSLVQPV